MLSGDIARSCVCSQGKCSSPVPSVVICVSAGASAFPFVVDHRDGWVDRPCACFVRVHAAYIWCVLWTEKMSGSAER